jgi:hypothetical protein
MFECLLDGRTCTEHSQGAEQDAKFTTVAVSKLDTLVLMEPIIPELDSEEEEEKFQVGITCTGDITRYLHEAWLDHYPAVAVSTPTKTAVSKGQTKGRLKIKTETSDSGQKGDKKSRFSAKRRKGF